MGSKFQGESLVWLFLGGLFILWLVSAGVYEMVTS